MLSSNSFLTFFHAGKLIARWGESRRFSASFRSFGVGVRNFSLTASRIKAPTDFLVFFASRRSASISAGSNKISTRLERTLTSVCIRRLEFAQSFVKRFHGLARIWILQAWVAESFCDPRKLILQVRSLTSLNPSLPTWNLPQTLDVTRRGGGTAQKPIHCRHFRKVADGVIDFDPGW
jgi:hypothetical protein